MARVFVTFGQKYDGHVLHPLDARAHRDGWFEFDAETLVWAEALARRHLLDRRYGVPLFAFAYRSRPSTSMYPKGCLARFKRAEDGTAVDATDEGDGS